MNEDYKAQIELIKNTTSINPNRFYIYDDQDADSFSEFYIFFREYLNSNEFGIEPAYFYFIDDNDISAFETPPKDGLYLIGISKGLIERFGIKLITYFNIEIFKNFKDVLTLQEKLPDCIGKRMHYDLVLFTYFHEFGHLIQFSSSASSTEKEEKLTGAGPFSIEDHVFELDADSFATVCVSSYFIKYLEVNPNLNLSPVEIKSNLSLMLSSLFIYFFSFNEFEENLYFEKYSHPHPLIRCINAVQQITTYVNDYLNDIIPNLKLEEEEIFMETFSLTKTLANETSNKQKFDMFTFHMENNYQELNDYHTKLITLIKNDPNSAVNVRNKIAKERR
jgi:hypothetical protein